MQDVSTQDLQDYVSALHDMYLHRLVQEQMEQDIEAKISALGKSQNHEKPTPPTKYEPEAESSEKLTHYVNFGSAFGVVAFLVVAFFIGVLVAGLVSGIVGFIVYNDVDSPTALNIVMCVYFILFACCAAFVFWGVVIDPASQLLGEIKGRNQQIRTRNTNAQERYNEQCAEYLRKMQEYNQAIHEDRERISNEQREKRKLVEQLAQLKQKMDESNRRLDEIKSVGILYGKYCDIVPIFYIYEYLLTGRCETRKEAYNLYEHESRLDNIADNISNAIRAGFSSMTALLSTIIQNQQVSIQNQYALVSVMEESNRLSAQILANTYQLTSETAKMRDAVSNLSGEVHHIDETMREYEKDMARAYKTMDIITYSAERTQQEVEYMNLMNYYSGKYGNDAYGYYYKPPSIR